ncbi:MAG: hypothetical protein U0768_02455 [Anaerolineae bacterium]
MSLRQIFAPAQDAAGRQRLRGGDLAVRVVAALAAFLLPTLLIALAGKDPLAVYQEFITGLTVGRLGDATMYAAILIICTASAMVTFNASLWNIGIEGQLAFGTIGATAVMIPMRDAPAVVLVPAMLAAGALAGALWASLVAVLRLINVNEIFSGFALNQIAGALVKFMLVGVWWEISQKRMSGIPFPENAALPPLGPINVWMIALSLVILVATVWVLARTPVGLRVRAVGLSRVSASFYGISANWVFVATLLVGGGLAGIAGMLTSSTYFHRFAPDVTSGFGFTAILIYLIARMNLVGVILLSTLFGLINAGTIGLQTRLGVDPSLAGLVQISIILALYLLQGKDKP